MYHGLYALLLDFTFVRRYFRSVGGLTKWDQANVTGSLFQAPSEHFLVAHYLSALEHFIPEHNLPALDRDWQTCKFFA